MTAFTATCSKDLSSAAGTAADKEPVSTCTLDLGGLISTFGSHFYSFDTDTDKSVLHRQVMKVKAAAVSAAGLSENHILDFIHI